MTTAKPQAKISRRLASRDPVAVVPSVAASQRCSATITRARIRGFRGIPCRTLTIGTEFLLVSILGGIPRAYAQSMGRRVLPVKGFQEATIGALIQDELMLCSSLAAFQRVAVLGLNGSGHAAAQGDGVDWSALRETLQYSNLSGEHVAFVDSGDGPLGLVIDALGGVVDEHARGIDHSLRCGFAFRCRGFLRAKQARLHGIDLHDHV